jgi:hypothetical protein
MCPCGRGDAATPTTTELSPLEPSTTKPIAASTCYSIGPSVGTTTAPTMFNPTILAQKAFPLHLKYPEEGYHKVLLTSLYNDKVPIYKWSKKVA